MIRLVIAALALSIVAACATGSAPRTSWGKAGVSFVDYRVDAGRCAVIAAQSNPLVDRQGDAGGIAGSNAQPPVGSAPGAPVSTALNTTDPGAAISIGGTAYRDQPSADFTMRANNQVRAQEIAMRREDLQHRSVRCKAATAGDGEPSEQALRCGA